MKLTQKVQLYIPSCKQDGSLIENRGEVLTNASLKMNRLFGGSTVTDGLGTYTTPDGRLVTEKVSIIESWGNEADFYESVYGAYGLLKYAIKLRDELKQDSIFLVINQDAFLIDDSYTAYVEPYKPLQP